jgi:hypothetical protein
MNRAICLALALAAVFAVPEASAEPVKWQYELLALCAERAMLNNENRDSATQEMLDMVISIKHKCFFFQIAPGY